MSSWGGNRIALPKQAKTGSEKHSKTFQKDWET